MDEVILWDAGLTADEINQFKDVRLNGTGDNRIIGLWHFDEKSGITTADGSGKGHTAALSNGVQWINSPVPTLTPP